MLKMNELCSEAQQIDETEQEKSQEIWDQVSIASTESSSDRKKIIQKSKLTKKDYDIEQTKVPEEAHETEELENILSRRNAKDSEEERQDSEFAQRSLEERKERELKVQKRKEEERDWYLVWRYLVPI